MKNIKTSVAVCLAVTLILTGAGALANSSGQVMVDSDLCSPHWTTVFTNRVDLRWDWSSEASKAQLEITDISGTTFTTNFTKNAASNYIWQVFTSEVPAKEDVYTLTLTFRTAGDEIAGVLTSRLAVVTGAFGTAPVDAVATSRKWSRVKDNVVIPYDVSSAESTTTDASAQLVITKQGGKTDTNKFTDVAGYYGWKLRGSDWGYGTFDLLLKLTGATNEWSATLTRQQESTIFSIQ